MTEEAQEMDVSDPQLEATTEASPEVTPGATPEAATEAAPEASPEAAPKAEPETAPEATPVAAPEAVSEATPEATPQSDQGVSDAGEAPNVPGDFRGGRRARRIPTRVFLANAMEEIRKLDFNKK